jgi:signal transduction histidine kinase
LSFNPIPPPVRIEQIVADGANHLPGETMHLPALTKNLEIDYTALSLVMPQKVRFRYRLEGRDDKWVEAGGRRQAFYSDLPPATYRFSVIACNNSGVWSEKGAAQAFIVAPAYYQTNWFRTSVAGAFLLGMWGIYRLRVWQIAAGLNARFEDRIAERNRLSADLHDNLMQSVQASKMIADQTLFEESQDTAQLRSAMAILSEWLGRATLDGQALLNALHASTSLKNDLAVSFQRAAELSHVASSMEFVLSVEGATRALHPIVRDDVYRIGSEAIRNSFLHAGAAKMVLHLTYGNDLIVRLSDDGKGLERRLTGSTGHGVSVLAEMQELATGIGGQFRLFSRENSGTEIELTVPGRIAYADFIRHNRLARVRNLWKHRKGVGHK